MLSELCKELNNWFCTKKYFGKFTIEDGVLIVPELQNGQYFRIVGSVFNDGVYEYPKQGLKDEEFEGAVWAMAVPKEVIALADEIAEWKNKYLSVDGTAMSPYISESFGGYTYQKALGDGSGNGASSSSWQSVFADRLKGWRKLK